MLNISDDRFYRVLFTLTYDTLCQLPLHTPNSNSAPIITIFHFSLYKEAGDLFFGEDLILGALIAR